MGRTRYITGVSGGAPLIKLDRAALRRTLGAYNDGSCRMISAHGRASQLTPFLRVVEALLDISAGTDRAWLAAVTDTFLAPVGAVASRCADVAILQFYSTGSAHPCACALALAAVVAQALSCDARTSMVWRVKVFLGLRDRTRHLRRNPDIERSDFLLLMANRSRRRRICPGIGLTPSNTRASLLRAAPASAPGLGVKPATCRGMSEPLGAARARAQQRAVIFGN